MSEIFLSVIVPAYNEEKRIPATLHKIQDYLSVQPFDSEIIVVDDGSQDQTVEVSRRKLKDFNHKVIESHVNEGKGSAVQKGMLAGMGKYLLFSDADMSTPIEEVERFIQYFEKDGYDCVIGSRALPKSHITIHQNGMRELMGKVFNRVARLMSFKGIRDSQCGFKCFKREAAQDLFSRQKIKGFSFDAEILYLAQRRGYRILETPVEWHHVEQSRVQLLRDPLLMFKDLIRIRWLHRNE